MPTIWGMFVVAERRSDKLSNTSLAKLFSVEHVASLLVVVFVSGGMWYSLAEKVATNTKDIIEVKARQAVLYNDIGGMKTDISAILESQKNQEKQNTRLEAQNIRALDILERRLGSASR